MTYLTNNYEIEVNSHIFIISYLFIMKKNQTNKTHNYDKPENIASIDDLSLDIEQLTSQKLMSNKPSVPMPKPKLNKQKTINVTTDPSRKFKNEYLENVKSQAPKAITSRNTIIIQETKVQKKAQDSYFVRKKNKNTSTAQEKKILTSNQYKYDEKQQTDMNRMRKKSHEGGELGVTKIIRQMKEEGKKNSLQEDMSQMESLLRSKRKQQDIQIIGNDRRKGELERAKQMLSGKVSIIWIFVISDKIQEEEQARIRKMYQGLSEQKYIVPFCKQVWEIKNFLQVPSSLFKIVSDLKNIEGVMKHKENQSVVQIYIYNEKGEKGISSALKYKAESRKVKGIFTKLQKVIERAQEEIENEIQLYMTKNGLNKRKQPKLFPSFIKLSGQDKTYTTLYRSNLYGAKNLPSSEKQLRYKQFMSLVNEKYGENERETKNIKDYKEINHIKNVYDMKQAKRIIQFYVRESFYYQILNSMLRTMKTPEEFKPCILPFNETYHSIKMYYLHNLHKNKRKVQAQVLYRGAKLRKRDVSNLTIGTYIEMLGFMSTSKNLQRAKEFTDKNGYMFVVEVPSMEINEKHDSYDHGFIDINENKLAPEKYMVEEEVLFNALNIYRVKKVEKTNEGYTMIYLQYGVMFNLLKKKKIQMTTDEKDILLNYEFCANLLNNIEDQGDVYLLNNEFQDSKQYYQEKIEKGEDENSGKYYGKLANVQHQCGQLEEADQNAKKSLQLQLKELDLNDHEKCMKVFSIHSKNAQISLQKEDYLDADKALNHAIEMIPPQNDYELAKKLRQRGEIKFKKGQIANAEKDFQISEQIFKSLFEKAEEKRTFIKRRYVFSFLTLWCNSITKEQLDEERESRMKEIQQLEESIINMKENINEELIRVNNSLKEVANYAQDKEKYEACVKKARAYLLQIKSRQTNDPAQKAKLKMLEATVQDYLDLAQSQKLLNEAIALVESTNPFHEDVGKYSTVLAQIQKQELQKFSNPKFLMKTKISKDSEPIPYNDVEHKEIVGRCRNNFEKAINVLLYNSKTEGSPQVMSLKNQLGELQFNEANFEKSEKIIQSVKESGQNLSHSELSKSCLTLSKIGYSRGQLKHSFQNIEEARQYLRKAIIKKEEQKYLELYWASETYLQIKLHRAKIYFKQLKHDMSLKDLQNIQKVIKYKFQDYESHSLFADIYELRGEIKVKKQIDDFDNYFEKAIKLREKQMGQYNLANAIAYCNYSKYLCLLGEKKEAYKALENAMQIFSCFSEEHPITWILHYCFGFYYEKQSSDAMSLEMLENCLEKASKKFDKTHITMNKIRFQYGKALHRSGRIQEAIKQFEELQNVLQEEITKSKARVSLNDESDDEKIYLKKMLYNSLKQSYRVIESVNHSFMQMSRSGIEKCDKNLIELNQSFRKMQAQK